jgi:hypothetical protein
MMIDQCIYDGIIIEIVGAMSDQDRIIVVRSHYVIAELYNSVYTSEYPLEEHKVNYAVLSPPASNAWRNR